MKTKLILKKFTLLPFLVTVTFLTSNHSSNLWYIFVGGDVQEKEYTYAYHGKISVGEKYLSTMLHDIHEKLSGSIVKLTLNHSKYEEMNWNRQLTAINM